MTVTSTAPRFTHTFEECLGGKRAPSHLEAIEEATAAWGKAHCHMTLRTGVDGSAVTETNCPGIAFTRGISREAPPTAEHTHESEKVTTWLPGHWFGDTTSFDNDARYVGACPTGLLPGQHLLPNGWITDPGTIARGHFILGEPEDAALLITGEGMGPSPPVTPAPVAPVSVPRRAYVSCSTARDGSKWGRFVVDQPDFPFGREVQPWRVHIDFEVHDDGEHMLVLNVESPGSDVNHYDKEPNYTIRLGPAYSFTPPIAQQDNVTGAGGAPLKWEAAQARDAARDRAQASGQTYCYVNGCFPSDADKEAFVKAFHDTAAAGGDMAISGPGRSGPVTLRYSLKGLEGNWAGMERCTK